MSNFEPVDPREKSRRRFLLISTASVGAVGAVATLIPFVQSMQPSERARAAGAPAELDVTTIAPGTLTTIEWRGKPIWVLHRTPAMIATLGNHNALLLDPNSTDDQQPDYARNKFRSIRPEYFVAVAICTHLGCIPLYRPEPDAPDMPSNWPGGFYCPCHGSFYDLAGRVFRNVPAPRNLEVPPHMYDGNKLVIGEEASRLTTG